MLCYGLLYSTCQLAITLLPLRWFSRDTTVEWKKENKGGLLDTITTSPWLHQIGAYNWPMKYGAVGFVHSFQRGHHKKLTTKLLYLPE